MFEFNIDEEKENEFPILPEGRHLLEVVSVEYKSNKSRTGKLIEVTLNGPSGDDDEYLTVSPLKFWFNVEHESEKVRNIGRGQFKTFLMAIDPNMDGTIDEEDLPDLVGAEVFADIIIDESGPFNSNRISRFVKDSENQEEPEEEEEIEEEETEEESELEEEEPEEEPEKVKAKTKKKASVKASSKTSKSSKSGRTSSGKKSSSSVKKKSKASGPVDFDGDDIPFF